MRKSLGNFKQKNDLSQTLEISQDSLRWKSWIYDSNFLRILFPSFLHFLWMCLKYAAPQHERHMIQRDISMKSMNLPSSPCKDHCINAICTPPPFACLLFFRPILGHITPLTHTQEHAKKACFDTQHMIISCDTTFFIIIIKRFVRVKDHTTVRLFITLLHPQFFNV